MCQEFYTIKTRNIVKVITVNRSCRCVAFDRVFNSSSLLKQFVKLLRPILYGKIYYYPSNIHYDNLIKQLNQTFETVDGLVELFREIQTTLKPVFSTFDFICHSFFNATNICQQFSTYNATLSTFTIFTEFLACTELNRFQSTNSELDMIYEGQNKSLTNNFLAGIVFMNKISNNDSLPKHVQFKIRMPLDLVDNTFRTQDR